jgi:glycosyltransferase involved in cell wall biosynthesis
VDPYDVDALADALRRVVEDRALAAALVARGRARAATFSWARTAEGTRAAWACAADDAA